MEANDKDFAAVAKENGVTVTPAVKVQAMDESFGPIQNQRQIVKWAFDKKTSVGDVKRYEVPNLGHVVVKLKKVNEEGLMAIDQARLSIEPKLKNKKKAELIKAKIKGSSLADIAKSSGGTVQTATDLTIENAVLPGTGLEQKVVGTAFAIGANKVSAPIEGISGVFVVQPKAVTKAPAITDYKEYVTKLKGQSASAPGRVIGALKADAEIEDNRQLFY